MISLVFAHFQTIVISIPVPSEKACLRLEYNKKFIFEFASQEDPKRTIETDECILYFRLDLKA